MKIPSETVALETKMESETTIETPRGYLGMSQIGHSCSRYLWYYFRWCFKEEISAKKRRIFERGNLEEERVVKDFERAGIPVLRRGEEMSDVFGHYKGHVDGIVDGFPGYEGQKHVLEIKGLKAASFRHIVKHGIAHFSYSYWAQVQEYMRHLKIYRTLFSITNKDTEERYYTRVKFDKESGMFGEKAELIISEDTLPPRIGTSTHYMCGWCAAKEICHLGKIVEKTCRTCQHVELYQQGVWMCGLTSEELSEQQQEAACHEYKCIISITEQQ